MTPESQLTDVSGATDSGSTADTSAASLSVGTENQPTQAEIGDSVTVQSGAGEGEIDESILQEFLPKEELDASPDKYAKALSRVQQSHERLWEKFRPLQRLEGYQALVERGTPEVLQQQLATLDSLITPVLDPETNQPVYQNGFQAFTTLPFFEQMDGKQSGFAVQAFNDLMNYQPNGNQAPLWQFFVSQSLGLDPNRLDDYRNIDALTAQSGQDLNELLPQIREDLRDAFKSMPAKVRDDLMQQDEETRNWHLEQQQERLQQKVQAEQREKAEAEARQRYQQELQDSISREQDADIEQQFSEGLSSVMEDVASKVTFSSDPKQDAALKAIVGAVLLPLRDSSNHAHMKPLLDALGIQMSSAFMEDLNAYTQNRREWKALDLANRKTQAELAMRNLAGPRARVMTKAAEIGRAVALALGGQMKAKAEARNGQLQEAGQIRPVVDGSAPSNNTDMVELAKQAGINLNDNQAVNNFIMQMLSARSQPAAG